MGDDATDSDMENVGSCSMYFCRLVQNDQDDFCLLTNSSITAETNSKMKMAFLLMLKHFS